MGIRIQWRAGAPRGRGTTSASKRAALCFGLQYPEVALSSDCKQITCDSTEERQVGKIFNTIFCMRNKSCAIHFSERHDVDLARKGKTQMRCTVEVSYFIFLVATKLTGCKLPWLLMASKNQYPERSIL